MKIKQILKDFFKKAYISLNRDLSNKKNSIVREVTTNLVTFRIFSASAESLTGKTYVYWLKDMRSKNVYQWKYAIMVKDQTFREIIDAVSKYVETETNLVQVGSDFDIDAIKILNERTTSVKGIVDSYEKLRDDIDLFQCKFLQQDTSEFKAYDTLRESCETAATNIGLIELSKNTMSEFAMELAMKQPQAPITMNMVLSVVSQTNKNTQSRIQEIFDNDGNCGILSQIRAYFSDLDKMVKSDESDSNKALIQEVLRKIISTSASYYAVLENKK